MTSERLTAILRERYETGAYADARLVISKVTVDSMPRPEPKPFELADWGISRLLDIPVFLDNSLPLGAWRLIDRNGDEIAAEGLPDPLSAKAGMR